MEKNTWHASSSYPPAFTSSNSESYPLVVKDTPFSIATRTLPSGYTSHPPPETTIQARLKSREPSHFLTGLKNISIRDTPPSYLRKIPEVDESSENYVLFGRRGDGTPKRMEPELEKMQERDSKLKRNIRRFRFVVRCAHLACSIVVISLLAANFVVFFRTQDHQINDHGRLTSAWGGSKVWPAIILLSVATLSASLSIMVLLLYFKSVKWANRMSTIHAGLMIAVSLVIISVWTISAGLFHKNGTPGFNVPNIWSWACNHKESSDQAVNFNQICITQEWSFICAFIEVSLEILTIGSFLLIFVRRRSKNEMYKTMGYPIRLKTAGFGSSKDPERAHEYPNADDDESELHDEDLDVKEDFTDRKGSPV